MKSYTVNTDASFSRFRRRAAWAYYIKGEDWHVKASGMFPEDIEILASQYAELRTFMKAMERVNDKVPEAERSNTMIYINTDCMFVIHVLNKKKVLNINHPNNRALVAEARKLIAGYKLIPRHVKAHTGNLTTARSYVNDWCDKAVRMEMGKAVYKK